MNEEFLSEKFAGKKGEIPIMSENSEYNDIKINEELKCVKLTATRQFIASIVAGWLEPMIAVTSLNPALKNHYVYYNGDKDLFEIIYYTDDCPEGTTPVEISLIEFKTIELKE